MARLEVLDPSTIPAGYSPQGAQSWATAPRKAKAFGLAPCHDDLMVGDLVLVAPVKDGFNSRAIRKSQRQFYNDGHAGWTHAAMYVGDGYIIEITPDTGVQRRHLGHYLPSHKLLFRRDKTLDDGQRYRMALRAHSYIGQIKYNVATILEIVQTRWFFVTGRSPKRYNVSPNARRVICSVLYNRCYHYGTNKGSCIADPDVEIHITPAHLSATDILSDVQVRWNRIL